MPSHNTFGRVFARLHPRRFQACFLSWTQAVAQLTPGALVSLDGKTVQASFDRATASSPLPMLSAWCAAHGGLVVGPRKTESTSNAITAIPDLLHVLALKGCLVTIDAMGGQTAIAAQIQDQGGDDLFALQGTQKKAYTAITAHFPQAIAPHLAWRTAEHCFDAFDDTHGHTGRRRGWIMPDLTALPELTQWPGLQAGIAVETMRMAPQHTPVTSDDRFYLASLGWSATACVTMMRQHWHYHHIALKKSRHLSLKVTLRAEKKVAKLTLCATIRDIMDLW